MSNSKKSNKNREKISEALQAAKEITELQKVYIHPNRKLSEKKKKFCRCVLHVAKNNPRWCNREKTWNNRTPDGKIMKDPRGKCYNPYATCAKSVGTTTGGKSCGYVFKSQGSIISRIPIEELVAYALLNYEAINKWAKKENLPDVDYILQKDIDEDFFRGYLSEWYNSKK
jgi:hypothetical protein